MTDKRFEVETNTDLQLSIKDNLTKKYPFNICCKNIDKFKLLSKEVLKCSEEMNKLWSQTQRFTKYNQELIEKLKPFQNLVNDYNIPFDELYITFEDTLDTLEKLRFDNADLIKTNQRLYDDLQETKNLKENVEKENEQLKERILELENELEKHIGSGEWDIRDTTCGAGKFRLEEWGERYHQFYNSDEALEDEAVVILLNDLTTENEWLKERVNALECANDGLTETIAHHGVRWDSE